MTTPTLPTACVAYTGPSTGPGVASITTYNPSATNGDPAFLPVTVTKTQVTNTTTGAIDTLYKVAIGNSTSNVIGYTIDINQSSTGTTSSIIQMDPGIEFRDANGVGAGKFPFMNKITLLVANNTSSTGAVTGLTTGTYVDGDVYNINLDTPCSNGLLGVQVTINRPLPSREFGGTVSKSVMTMTPIDPPPTSSSPVCTDCSCLIPTITTCSLVNVPIINILGQLTVDFSDIGDITFTVCDRFSYYEEEKIVCDENKCVIDYIDKSKIKQTKFRQCGPEMVSVVKGEGKTLRDKALFLWNANSSTIGVSFDTFYGNLVFYAMVKYILSRLLYGKFNINYLLGKYNERFLRDLGHSRFCASISLFVDCNSVVFGYDQYFLFNCPKK